jgi:O-Antigen ligase
MGGLLGVAVSFQSLSRHRLVSKQRASGGAMRYLAIAIAACLAVFTALSMALAPSFVNSALASAGFLSIYPFDVVLGAAILVLFTGNAIFFTRDPVPVNRLVVSLCIICVGYQLLVVLPAAVLLHDLRPIDVLRAQEVRFGLILVLVVYGVVLRYCRPALLVAFFDIAAAALALWVIYRFLTTGEQGYWDGGVFRLRAVWGGAALLFGWLFLASLFYWPVRPWRLVLAILALGGIILANHRSGFLALLAAFVMQMLATSRVTRRAVLTTAVIAVVGVGVYYAAPSVRDSAAYSLRTMFSAGADPNAADRVVRSRLGFDYFVQHPLGDYVWNRRYYLVNLRNGGWEPHNFIVQLLVTQGIVASLLFLVIIGLAGSIAWRNRRDQLSAVMLAYLTFYLVFCLFNTNIYSLENVALLFVAVALILHQNRTLQADTAPARLEAVDASASSCR